jgi:hypothetical protein
MCPGVSARFTCRILRELLRFVTRQFRNIDREHEEAVRAKVPRTGLLSQPDKFAHLHCEGVTLNDMRDL